MSSRKPPLSSAAAAASSVNDELSMTPSCPAEPSPAPQIVLSLPPTPSFSSSELSVKQSVWFAPHAREKIAVVLGGGNDRVVEPDKRSFPAGEAEDEDEGCCSKVVGRNRWASSVWEWASWFWALEPVERSVRRRRRGKGVIRGRGRGDRALQGRRTSGTGRAEESEAPLTDEVDSL
jgi:hypothetical protein